jgi:methionine-rich copper-binding protein CopC
MSWNRPARSDRPTSGLAGAALALLVAGLIGLVGAQPAAAHDSLTGSTPADGATVTSAPEQVVLTFSAQVKDLGLTVLVTSPDGRRVGDGPARVEGRDVIAPLLALTEPGRYVVAYRVVSSDGHPIQGRTAFVLDVPTPSPTATPTEATPGSPSASASASASAAPGTATPDASPVAATSSDGGSPLPWVLAGLVVVGVAVGAVAVARSRST